MSNGEGIQIILIHGLINMTCNRIFMKKIMSLLILYTT